LQSLRARLPSSVSTTDEWERQQSERLNADFFQKSWPQSNAPARAVERIASGELKGEDWLKASAKLERILANRKGALIALMGARGPGKTQLGVCAMHRVCRAGRSARYVKALDFYAELKAAYSPHTQELERDIIRQYCKPRLLVIDGMEERGETAWEDRMLSHLIDRRYDDMTDTILIGNLTEEKLLLSVGPSADSRLRETGGIIKCEWPSFRG
jgi:DNA replication protein DnaC